MKKFLKSFLIIPILLITMLCGFACQQEALKSISLSLTVNENCSLTSGYYRLKSNVRSYSINVDIQPNNYTVNDFTWESNATDVLTVYLDSVEKKVTVSPKGVGIATITAKTYNSNGQLISASLKFVVEPDADEMSFSQSTFVTSYTGEDIIEADFKKDYPTYKIMQDEDDGTYEYLFFDIYKGDKGEYVDKIINASTYQIICQEVKNPEIQTSAMLKVEPAKLNLTGENFQITYGDELPSGLYNENNLPRDLLTNGDIGSNLLGIGKDSETKIGKYIITTKAQRGSNVGSHDTSVYFELVEDEQIRSNYQSSAVITPGSLNISKKEVVLSIQDQSIIYGANIEPNKFALYSYKEYTENENKVSGLQALTDENVNYSSNILLGQPSYKFEGNDAVKNSVGLLNVIVKEPDVYGQYDLCYENATTTSPNLDIVVEINGKLTINPRTLQVLPIENQQKVYGENDYATFAYRVVEGSFINKDTIPNFLQVDYGAGPDTLGEGNYLADVGTYYYKIDNALNTNYKISLGERAVKGEGLTPEQEKAKIKFTIVASEIVIVLEDEEGPYKNPTSVAGGGTGVHTLSYFPLLPNKEVPDYKANLKSVKINNEEILTNTPGEGKSYKAENFNEEGTFILRTGGSFNFTIKLTKIVKEGYHTSYTTEIGEIYFGEGVSSENNYNISLVSSSLDLTKVTITIKPKLTTKTKEFDGKADDNGMPAGFGQDYEVIGLEGQKYTIEQIASNYRSLLTMKKDGYYTRIDSNGVTDNKCSSFKNCGDYQIFLNTVTFASPEVEYFDVKFDTSKPYYFSILPYSVIVSPSLTEEFTNQNKIYGENDPALLYTYSEIPEDSITADGSLVRVAGENVGDYLISLGNLTFGENYTLTLSSTPVYFTIYPRTVTVKPISYTTIYGSSYPQKIDWTYTIAPGYNSSILKAPVFSGEFALNGEKIGDYYPVKINPTTKEVESYNIVVGTFACNNNYSLSFNPEATYKINKRDVTLNIVSQKRENSENISLTVEKLGSAYYEISNLVVGSTSELNLTLTVNESVYKVAEEGVELKIFYNGEEVTSCYSIQLGHDIVYTVNVAVIELAIVESKLKQESIVSYEYNGKDREDSFSLICTTEGYEIFELEEGEDPIVNLVYSKYSFAYSAGETSNVIPKNVGSYVASLNLADAGSKIIILNKNHVCDSSVCDPHYCSTKYIEFTAIDGKVVNNCVLSVSNYGYLDITRTNISVLCDESYLSFTSTLSYGGNTLSALKETYTVEGSGVELPVFGGANEETISLMPWDNGLNFNYVEANYSLSSLDAGRKYPISITVQARKVGTEREIDNNYNPLNLTVYLSVVPKELNIIKEESGFNFDPLSTVSFDGTSKFIRFALSLEGETTTEKYAITYNYYKIKTVYAGTANGAYVYYDYVERDGVFVADTSAGAKSTNFKSSPIRDAGVIDKLVLLNQNGAIYLVINGQFCLDLESSEYTSPVNAGVYICIASCTTTSNYTFYQDGTNKGSSVNAIQAFEIERSANISIDNWKDSFYYTTQFNLADRDSLPFEFTMSPNFKEDVTFTMDANIEWPANYMLNVGDYSVTVGYESNNYFYSKAWAFSVEKLQAEIVFPAKKTYVYVSDDTPITSFLNNIRVVEKDKDGNATNSFYYTYDGDLNSHDYLTFAFYLSTDKDTPLENIPSKVSIDDQSYLLKVTYGGETSNYYGEGIFEYKIIEKPYMGQIGFHNTDIMYNPTYTPAQLYALIHNNMFSIGLESGYSVRFFIENNQEIKPEITPTTTEWMEEILEVGNHNLYIEVDFEDVTTANFTDNAILTIKKASINDSYFSEPSTTVYTYTGFEIYNPLKFFDVTMSPETYARAAEEGNDTNIIEVVKDLYEYKVTKINNTTYSVFDNIDNLIFKVVYTYEYYEAKDSNAFFAFDGIPRDPLDKPYRVTYTFTFGENYSGTSITISKKEFSIAKVNVLCISAGDIAVAYQNQSVSDLFELKDVVVKNYTGGESKTNMNVRASVSSSEGYSAENGVHIFVYFTNEAGEKVTGNVNAGTYKMNVTLLYDSNYDLSKYFVNVKFGTEASVSVAFGFNPNSIGDSSVDPESGMPNNKESLQKTGAFALCSSSKYDLLPKNYSFDNWSEAFTITPSPNIDGENKKIILDSSHTIEFGVRTGAGIEKIVIKKYNNSGGYDNVGVEILRGVRYSFADFVAIAEEDASYIFLIEIEAGNTNFTANQISFKFSLPDA